MTIFAHAAVSVLLGRGFYKIRKTQMAAKTELFFAFCGMLPDIPLGLVSLTGQFTPGTHHHEWITHTPLFWPLLALLVGLIKKQIGMALLIGAWSHLATDWYGGGDGIKFLWPFSDSQFGVALSGVHGRPAFEHYFSNPIFLLMEACLFVYLVYRFYKMFQKNIICHNE